jgi:DNA-directed RNA polymerase specialized sigma24 family protein
VSADQLSRARSGDEQAFAQLTDVYRQELQVHCYRILGSAQDAEEAPNRTPFSVLGRHSAPSRSGPRCEPGSIE